jgi:hypothetical protein
MQRLAPSGSRVVFFAVLALLATAFFTLVSAADLQYATLQGIDGPLSAQELSALQLSNSLTTIGGVILTSVLLGGLFTLLAGRHVPPRAI